MSQKRFMSMHELEGLSIQLAQKILQSGFRPTILLGIWRGGCIPAIYIHEFLEWKGGKIQHFPLKVRSYAGIEESGEVTIEGLQELLKNLRPEERILVVDDVFDTGKTMEAVLKALRNHEVKIATLFFKPTKNQTKLKPDFFVEETESWIVFPHELKGLSEEEIKRKSAV